MLSNSERSLLGCKQPRKVSTGTLCVGDERRPQPRGNPPEPCRVPELVPWRWGDCRGVRSQADRPAGGRGRWWALETSRSSAKSPISPTATSPRSRQLNGP